MSVIATGQWRPLDVDAGVSYMHVQDLHHALRSACTSSCIWPRAQDDPPAEFKCGFYTVQMAFLGA